MVPKRDSDLKELSSYRPISLLNVDYKIFSQILPCRLNEFLGDYIGLDQTGFVRNRPQGDSIQRLLGLIEYVHHTKNPLCIQILGQARLDIYEIGT